MKIYTVIKYDVGKYGPCAIEAHSFEARRSALQWLRRDYINGCKECQKDIVSFMIDVHDEDAIAKVEMNVDNMVYVTEWRMIANDLRKAKRSKRSKASLERNRKWREERKEELAQRHKAYVAKYREFCLDEDHAKQKKYYAKNRKKILAKSRERYLAKKAEKTS